MITVEDGNTLQRCRADELQWCSFASPTRCSCTRLKSGHYLNYLGWVIGVHSRALTRASVALKENLAQGPVPVAIKAVPEHLSGLCEPWTSLHDKRLSVGPTTISLRGTTICVASVESYCKIDLASLSFFFSSIVSRYSCFLVLIDHRPS